MLCPLLRVDMIEMTTFDSRCKYVRQNTPHDHCLYNMALACVIIIKKILTLYTRWSVLN